MTTLGPDAHSPSTSHAARTLIRLASLVELACEEQGMTFGQYRALMLLADAPQQAVRIAERFAVSRAAVSQSVAALESRGWVQRVPLPGDRRGKEIQVTGEGRAAVHAIEQQVQDQLGEMVGDDALASLVDALLRTEAALDARIERLTGPDAPEVPVPLRPPII